MADKVRPHRGRWTRVGVVVALAVALVVPLGNSSVASAQTGGGTDATGDVAPTPECRADVTAFSADYTDETISVTAGMACGSNPNTDANWTQGSSEIDWLFDVNGDDHPDFAVGVVGNLGNIVGYQAQVVDLSDFSFGCGGHALWDGNKTFGATIDSTCIGDPSSIRVHVFTSWDVDPSSRGCPCTNDDAPDGNGLTGDIARSFSPATLGYPTACNGADHEPTAFADAGLAADCAKAWGLALGKADGSFGENDRLIRSQVASFLERYLTTNGADLTDHVTFPDVNPDTVPNPQVRDEIELLAGVGVIAGFSDGTFGPGATMSAAQAATFVMRTLELLGDDDLRDRGSTSKNYEFAVGKGLLDPNAKDLHGAVYAHAASDATARGLLADMLAQSLEKLGKVYYADCTAAQNAGAAPMQKGDSSYRPELDPDGDGVACDASP